MANDKISMWGHGSGRAMRVHWILQEFGLDYDVHPIQSRTGETLTDEYTAINPKQKIPSLKHGDFILTESPAIIAYIADSFEPPQGSYAPRDPQGRACGAPLLLQRKALMPPAW